MAKRIDFAAPAGIPPMPAASADAELAALLQALHERGLLRLAADVVGALPRIGGVLAAETKESDIPAAIANLASLIGALGRIPPDAFAAALEKVGAAATADTKAAPGLTGAVRLLRDEALWRGLAPVLDALRTLGAPPAARMEADHDNHPTDRRD
jgi:uncharacterized protein YjgD (DUF1641 family)